MGDQMVLTIGRNGHPCLWILDALYNLGGQDATGFTGFCTSSAQFLAFSNCTSILSIFPL